MDPQELIAMLNNRLVANEDLRRMAVERGDIEEVNRLDLDTAKTQATLAALTSGE